MDAEVIESGEEEEWEETNEEVRVQVAGVELVMSGPHDHKIYVKGQAESARERQWERYCIRQRLVHSFV